MSEPTKYTKKPITVEAWQFTEEVALNYWNNRELPPFGCSSIEGEFNGNKISYAYFYIETLEGTMKANLGDWIIKGINGEFYPCKPDIFEKTYEKVGQSVSSMKMLDDWLIYKQNFAGFAYLPEVERVRIEATYESGWLAGFSVGHAESREQKANETPTPAEALEALYSIWEIRAKSDGIAGWHLNGDIAAWDEFEFENYIETIRRALCVLQRPSVDLGLMLDALKKAESVISTINHAERHNIIEPDGGVLYWQTDDWVSWATKDQLPCIKEAIDHLESAGVKS